MKTKAPFDYPLTTAYGVATTQIIEYCNNSIPPPCPIHGMGLGMPSCVAESTTKITLTWSALVGKKILNGAVVVAQ